ncbi:MAG: nitroreductase/quinone reductase family protein [Candidatus Binataceae bacterium]
MPHAEIARAPRAEKAEAAFFRALNNFAEPLARAGFGAPAGCGPGLVVIETKGRRSGRARRVPLAATVLGDVVMVSTVRAQRSQWAKNLAANREVTYWLRGMRRKGIATVFEPSKPPPEIDALPAAIQPLVRAMIPIARDAGIAFAVLAPRR